MQPVRWGIVSTAKIGTEKVIPGMQQGEHCRIDAIASRDIGRAREAASRLGIPRAYGSYEELFADSDIEAIYNPLPNHLHVPVTRQAAEAGKHVLCEKPIALTADEAAELIEVRDRTGVMINEAFMVRHHPQWLKTRELVRDGSIGELRVVQGLFSYMNVDPTNIRNMAEIGGGTTYDIGCYPIVTSRFVFGAEPTRVVALMERDPNFGTDRLVSALMDFPTGQASFVCSTQLVSYQRMQICGTTGRIEVEIPFNAPPDRPCRIFVDDGSALGWGGEDTIEFDICDQYGLQGDAFSRALRNGEALDHGLEDAVANMRVIDALFRSARSGGWEDVQA